MWEGWNSYITAWEQGHMEGKRVASLSIIHTTVTYNLRPSALGEPVISREFWLNMSWMGAQCNYLAT